MEGGVTGRAAARVRAPARGVPAATARARPAEWGWWPGGARRRGPIVPALPARAAPPPRSLGTAGGAEVGQTSPFARKSRTNRTFVLVRSGTEAAPRPVAGPGVVGLAVRPPGHPVDDDHVAGALEPGQAAALDRLGDHVRIGGSTGRRRHHGGDRLAESVVGHADP